MQKNTQTLAIFLGGPMGPIHPVWALAAIHPRWGNRSHSPEECERWAPSLADLWAAAQTLQLFG